MDSVQLRQGSIKVITCMNCSCKVITQLKTIIFILSPPLLNIKIDCTKIYEAQGGRGEKRLIIKIALNVKC